MEKKKFLRRTFALVLAASMLLAFVSFLTGCSEASRANYNISKQADYFESERRVTVYNARTDNVVLEIEGYISITNNDSNELVVTCKVGPDQYKKDYVYLNSYTLYIVEDITGTHTDPYHYKLYLHSLDAVSVDVKP